MDNKVAEEWIKVADEDLEVATHLIQEGWFYRAALYHLQQAAEKHTKAFLISKGWKLRKIHDLEILMDEASVYAPWFKDYLGLGRQLTAHYTGSRYPPLSVDDPKPKNIQQLLKKTTEFIARIKQLP